MQRDVGRQYVDQFLSQVETLQDLPYEMLSQRMPRARLERSFSRLFDKNGDGKLDADERTAMVNFVKRLEARQ